MNYELEIIELNMQIIKLKKLLMDATINTWNPEFTAKEYDSDYELDNILRDKVLKILYD